MATNTPAETANDNPEATSDQEVTPQATQTEATPETGGNGNVTPPDTTSQQQEQKLPDTHPLVKAFEAQKAELKDLKIKSAQSADLDTELQSTKDQLAQATAGQARLERLEEFLTALGGPLSRALDSKSFTRDLFESDTDVKELVDKWNQDNPTATSAALRGGSGTRTGGGISINDALRAAAR